MRVPSTFRRPPIAIDLQLTPLIDCVFLLMIYFLWTTGMHGPEQAMPAFLQEPPAGQSATAGVPPPAEADFDRVVIRLHGAGAPAPWTVNDAPIASLANLEAALRSIARIKRDVPIVLDAEENVPLGEVIDLVDRARMAGLTEIQFAAAID